MTLLSTAFVSRSGNTIVDSLIMGTKWDSTLLSWSIRASAPNDSPYSSGFSPLNAVQRTAAQQAIARWASVCNLQFVEVSDDTNSGVIRFGTCSSNIISTSAAYYPNPYESGGDIWFGNSNTSSPNNPLQGNYAYATFVHELGHALGLKHPHSVTGQFPTMDVGQDAMQNSIMSYRSYLGDSTNGGYSNGRDSFAYGPMVFDIAAIQQLYGANYHHASDDTWYKFDPARSKIFATVWDGGGIDTYDLSSYSSAVTIDLRPGYWTTAAESQLAQLNYYELAYGYSNTAMMAPGNVCNALLCNSDERSLIENALGGGSDDTITGNQTANQIFGGQGNDTIWLGSGADTIGFQFGDGADLILDATVEDKIYLQNIRQNQLKIYANDFLFSVGIKDVTDEVIWLRTSANPKIITEDGLFAVESVSAAGSRITGSCLYYAGSMACSTDRVMVDALSGAMKYDLSNDEVFYSVEQLDSSANIAGGLVLRGTNEDNVLTASNSIASGDQLWGRFGDDLLIGGTGSDTFWYGANEGRDTIKGAYAADVVRLYNVNSKQLDFSISGRDLIVSIAGSSDILTICEWATQRVRFATTDIQVPFAPLLCDTINDTMISGSADGKVVLDLLSYSGIQNIDNHRNLATNGSVLRGNNGSNVLCAGNPGSGAGDHLWGRAGDDKLIGGNGQDTFWYGIDEGDDVISGFAVGQDRVMLYSSGLTLASVSVSVLENTVSLRLGAGTLTINEGAALLGDQSGAVMFSTTSRANIVYDNILNQYRLVNAQ